MNRYVTTFLLLAIAGVAGGLVGVVVGDGVLALGAGDPWDAVAGFVAGVAVFAAVVGIEWRLVGRVFQKCPRCASYIRAEATRCVYCGADVPTTR